MQEIYLDNSATTKVCAAAAEAALRMMQQCYGNPSSLHRKGLEAENELNAAKKRIASMLNCAEQELYFTSGATESNNLALQGAALARKRRGNKIITTAIEHPSVRETMAYLTANGFEIITLPPNENGSYSPADFFEAVDEKTILVSAMMVNNETGLLLPIAEIAKAVKRKNPDVLFHTDAVQGFGKLPLKLKNSGIDLLSASGHKLYAPKGIGLLYLARGVRLTPLLYGGGQQNGVRVGTDNVPLAVAFGAAVADYTAQAAAHFAHYRQLKTYLLDAVASIPEITVNSTDACVPYIVNLSVEKLRSEVLLHHLEADGIYVSSGSACSKGAKSYVLEALGLPASRIDTALRISFSPATTTAELDALVLTLQDGINRLAKIK